MKDDSTPTTTGQDAGPALSRRRLLTAGGAVGVAAAIVGSVPKASAAPVSCPGPPVSAAAFARSALAAALASAFAAASAAAVSAAS